MPFSTQCDGCDATATQYHIGHDGNSYPFCDLCYNHLQATIRASEYVFIACEHCNRYEATHVYGENNLNVCEECFESDLSIVDDRPICEECEEKFATHADDDGYLVCDDCQEEVVCEDCGEEPATCTFYHIDSRSFRLCDACFTDADHEPYYGADFGSAPRLRMNDQWNICACASPCSMLGASVCVQCKGILVQPPSSNLTVSV